MNPVAQFSIYLYHRCQYPTLAIGFDNTTYLHEEPFLFQVHLEKTGEQMQKHQKEWLQ